MRKKSIVQPDGQAQERAQAKLERNRRWFERKISTFLVRAAKVSRQECERQQCERHQCEANSANANSAKGSTVRMPTVRMRQRCECQQCECDSSAKDDSPNCAKPIGLSFFFLLQKLLQLFTSIFDLKLPITPRVSIYQEMCKLAYILSCAERHFTQRKQLKIA